MAVADPDILVLFEDWLDELELEVISVVKQQARLAPGDLARKLGLSHRGATFILSKLAREGKLPQQV
jgi:hypothetical protein